MRLSIDAYERMAGNILKIYEQAELEMTRRVANRVKRGVTQPGWTEQKYSEMKAVTRQMSKVVDSLHRDFNVQAMQYVETGYEDGRNSFINEAREFADLSQVHELTPTAIKVANIMGDLDMSMSAADRLILRQANDAYANIIGETSALIATGGYTEKQAVQIALNRFADKGISSFVDKAGRHWDMSTYAEMATLTAIERATRQGYTDTMQEFGFDLAIISSHYGACPLCEAWENVVISISGKDTHYLSLADAEAGGCFHPRCMHVFSTYYDGITRGGRDRPSPVGFANPGYAARSQQRAWERQERKWKRRMAAATTPEEERAAYARVRMYQDKIRGLIADYNNTVDPSVDYLPRKYDREGGRVKLSDSAKKLRPVVIPQAQAITTKKEHNRIVQLKPGLLPEDLERNTNELLAKMDTREAEAYVAALESQVKTYNDNLPSACNTLTNEVNYNSANFGDPDVAIHETTHYLDHSHKVLMHQELVGYGRLTNPDGTWMRDANGRIMRGEKREIFDREVGSISSYLSEKYTPEMKTADQKAFYKYIGISPDAEGFDRFSAFMHMYSGLNKTHSTQVLGNLTDMIDGLIDGELPIAFVGGHGEAYWKSSLTHLHAESLAGYTILRSTHETELLDVFGKVAPNLTKLLSEGYDYLWMSTDTPIEVFIPAT